MSIWVPNSEFNLIHWLIEFILNHKNQLKIQEVKGKNGLFGGNLPESIKKIGFLVPLQF